MWKALSIAILFLSITTTVKTKDINHKHIVDRHNYYRKMVGVNDIQYSQECANFAQKWAENLASKNSGLTHSETNKYGENCYWNSGEVDEYKVVDKWAAEKQFFNTNKRTYTHKSGHYSQVVWHDTKFVGVGMAVASDGSEYWVATYYPSGNYVGEKAY